MKNLIVLFACLNVFGASAQTDSAKFQDEIQLVHNKNVVSPRVIRSFSKCKVWLVNNSSPISGKMTFTSDSTATINGKSISLNEIETIRVTNDGGVIIGGILSLGGAVITGVGALLLQENNLSAQLLGLSGILLGPIPLSTGLIVLGVSSKKFDMEKWHFEVIDG